MQRSILYNKIQIITVIQQHIICCSNKGLDAIVQSPNVIYPCVEKWRGLV